MGKLYIVATPIGNLEDITIRAIETLKKVDIIACEDTRHTKKLLYHYEISKRLISYHSYNNKKQVENILSLMKEGLDIALVTDGGTPGISDPGPLLIRMARENNMEIIPIPGVSSVTTLMSVSGVASKNFCFFGFLSPKKGKRKKELERIIENGYNSIVLESPYRVMALLEEITSIDREIKIVVGREMTKVHEEFLTGSVTSVIAELEKREKIKGEFTILIIGKKKV